MFDQPLGTLRKKVIGKRRCLIGKLNFSNPKMNAFNLIGLISYFNQIGYIFFSIEFEPYSNWKRTTILYIYT